MNKEKTDLISARFKTSELLFVISYILIGISIGLMGGFAWMLFWSFNVSLLYLSGGTCVIAIILSLYHSNYLKATDKIIKEMP